MIKRSGFTIGMACLVSLSACSAGTNDPNLSPAEQKLRVRNAQYNNTLIEGAVIGTAGGAALGLLTGGNAKSAVIGGIAGGLAGTGLAYIVANRTEAQQQNEDTYHKAIDEAQRVTQQATEQARDAQVIAQAATNELQTLQARYNSKQISAEAYESTIVKYQTDAADLKKEADVCNKQSKTMQEYAAARKNDPTMRSAAATTMSNAQTLSESAGAILTQLSQVPAVPPTAPSQNAA